MLIQVIALLTAMTAHVALVGADVVPYTGSCVFYQDKQCSDGDGSSSMSAGSCTKFASGFDAFKCSGYVSMCTDGACGSCTQVSGHGQNGESTGCIGIGSYIAMTLP